MVRFDLKDLGRSPSINGIYLYLATCGSWQRVYNLRCFQRFFTEVMRLRKDAAEASKQAFFENEREKENE